MFLITFGLALVSYSILLGIFHFTQHSHNCRALTLSACSCKVAAHCKVIPVKNFTFTESTSKYPNCIWKQQRLWFHMRNQQMGCLIPEAPTHYFSKDEDLLPSATCWGRVHHGGKYASFRLAISEESLAEDLTLIRIHSLIIGADNTNAECFDIFQN